MAKELFNYMLYLHALPDQLPSSMSASQVCDTISLHNDNDSHFHQVNHHGHLISVYDNLTVMKLSIIVTEQAEDITNP